MSLELQVAVVAFAIAFPLTYVLRLPTRANRGLEVVRIPRIGGFSIYAAFLGAPVLLALLSDEAHNFMRDDWRDFAQLGVCGGLVFLVGARDDFGALGWKPKFAAQFVAAIGLYISGYRVGEVALPGGNVDLGYLDPVVTVFWLVLITNAVNLIDGRNGVAAGVSALVAGTMSYVAWDLGHELIALLFAALAGASLGFVPFNLPHARRLLGDSGAYFLGFTIAGLSVAGFVDSTGRVPLYIPLAALGLPVLDVGVALLRRALDNRHPFEYDQDHFHDRIARRTRFGPLGVALVTYAIAAVFCGAALLLHDWYKSGVGSAVIGTAVVAFAVALVVILGYVETLWNSVHILGLRGKSPASSPVADS